MSEPQHEAGRGNNPAHGPAPEPACGQCGRRGDVSRDTIGISTLYAWTHEGVERYVCRLGCLDVEDDLAELAIVKRTLAASYRQQAGWTNDSSAQEEFYSLARQVEAYEAGDACCPCCQEVTCDTGCPMEPVRSAPETASVGVPMTPDEFDAFTRKHGIRWEPM